MARSVDPAEEERGVIAKADRTPRWRRALRPARALAWVLCSHSDGGGDSPPNDWASSGWVPDGRSAGVAYDISFREDAGTVVLFARYDDRNGTPADEKCLAMIPRAAFRRLALWWLWRWAWGEWFGLRRWLYFRWLLRRVAGWRVGT